jgi:translocation and assembly module TamB
MSYKRASYSLITVFTGILCLFAILLSTPWGTQLTLYFVGDISPIQVKYRSGAFLKDLQLSQLTINNEQTEINATNIGLTLNLRCLWRNQLCIDELSLASLQVNLKENNATSSNQLMKEIIIQPIFP